MSVSEAEPVGSRISAGALFVLAAGLSWSFTGISLRLAPDLELVAVPGVAEPRHLACAFAEELCDPRAAGRPAAFHAPARIGVIVALRSA